MAKIEFKGIDNYRAILKELSFKAEDILKASVYEGAAVVVEAVKSAVPVSQSVSAGDLRDSVGLSSMRNDNGYINTKLGFDGYDSKGVPNAVKARVLESGRSDVANYPKHPFVRQATRAVQARAVGVMETELDRRIDDYMKSKE